MNLKGKNIAIVGFGVEGVSLLHFAQSQNVARIAVFSEKELLPEFREVLENQRDVPVSVGPFPSLADYDVIFRSPSISPTRPAFLAAKEKGKTVTSVTNLFFSLCPCPVIGVSGTKGKGTTASLIYEMLKNDGKDAYLGGNIGVPPLDFLSKLTPQSVVVLELSSFQLWDAEMSPHISVLVMVTQEHLDVHADTQEYITAKSHLFSNQQDGDFAIINWDYPNGQVIGTSVRVPLYKTSIHHEYSPGCFVKDKTIVFSTEGREERIIPVDEIFIPGTHNWQNACSAVAAAKLAGVSTEAIFQTLQTFHGLIHRLEFVREIGGVRYFDDSFSTTPETAGAAIAAFSEPKVVILGGSSKNSDFAELGKMLSESQSIRGIIGIGTEWPRIKSTITQPDIPMIEGTKTMEEIVAAARGIAQSGDVVILSPACASFDMFKNYKDRGDQFKRIVNSLSV